MKSRETGKNNPKISKLNNKFVQKHHIFRNFAYILPKISKKYHILAYFLYNKRDFSAKSPLLLLALRPRLFNFVKSPTKIVDASTILIGILSLFGVFFFVSPVSAASLTLTLPTDMSLSVSADRNNGYGTKEGTIKVETDAMWGYTLGIKAKDTTNGNTLMNGSHKLPSISQSITDYQGSGAANTWAYKPSKKDSTTNNNFLPGPSTTGDTIEKTSTSNAGAATDYTITMAAKVNSTLPSGKYQNTFVISAVANAVSYTINYNPNNGNWSEVNKQEGSTLGNKFTISSTEPNRTDYKFIGWCDQITSDENCSGKTYTAGQEYTIESYSPNVTLNLYAIWKYDMPTTMQDFKTMSVTKKANVIRFMQQDKQYELTDSRDGKTYYVAKLKDGNVWMTENLDFDIKSGVTLTPDNTDIKANWTPNLSTYTTDTSTWKSSHTAQESYDPGNKCWTGTITTNGGPVTSATYGKDCSPHDPSHYHVGNYYNWTAAVAMNDSSKYTTDKTDVDQSICPAGWRLPKYDGTGSFIDLKNKTSFTSGTSGNIQKDPYYFVYGGYRTSSSNGVGGYGRYWSSVVINSSTSYYLYFGYSGALYPQNNEFRSGSDSVRCLVRRERTMQNVSEWGSDVKEHEIVTAIDERDGNTYKVTRLKDGKLWMIDNLRLGDSKLTNRTLTSSNTDITASAYTLPNSSTSGFNNVTVQHLYVPESDSGNVKKVYGGYYTWMAATAGTGGSSNGANASSSICPKGWRLPTGGSGGEFETMASKYNNSNSMLHNTSEIPGFYLSGFFLNSAPDYQGSLGRYWSSTASTVNNAYFLRLTSAGAAPVDNHYKLYGCSVRCLARD